MRSSGDVVQVAHSDGLAVEQGALAVLVDGAKVFPELTDAARRCVERRDIASMAELICVLWVKSDPRWKGQRDGFYVKERFQALGECAEDAGRGALQRPPATSTSTTAANGGTVTR